MTLAFHGQALRRGRPSTPIVGTKRYAVMGAGEVGCHLARGLSAEGHKVTLIDRDPAKRSYV